jgi:hypothetical protein
VVVTVNNDEDYDFKNEASSLVIFVVFVAVIGEYCAAPSSPSS